MVRDILEGQLYVNKGWLFPIFTLGPYQLDAQPPFSKITASHTCKSPVVINITFGMKLKISQKMSSIKKKKIIIRY